MTIGGSDASDITIAGDPSLSVTEAKIVNKKGVYTVSGVKNPITVNNKPVKTKVLRPGDLIKIGNSTIVFDEGVKNKVKESTPSQKKK